MNLEVAHDALWRNLGVHHRVHVSASHVRRQQNPTPMRTDLLNRLQNGVTADLVEVIGNLTQTFPLG